MFFRDNGFVKGVLNDFDMASVGLTETQRTPSHGTGTRLFMAIELLGVPTPPHYYRHDLESLLYVMLWHASRYNYGVIIRPSPYERWGDINIDMDILEAYKVRFIHAEEPQLTPQFMRLKEWIQRVQALFRNGFQVRRKAGEVGDTLFLDETLGDVVTFDTFGKICSRELQAMITGSSGPCKASRRL